MLHVQPAPSFIAAFATIDRNARASSRKEGEQIVSTKSEKGEPISPQLTPAFSLTHSLAQLFKSDVDLDITCLVAPYPSSQFCGHVRPNNTRYLIQDGAPVGFSRTHELEVGRVLAVAGAELPIVLRCEPHPLLLQYWRDLFRREINYIVHSSPSFTTANINKRFLSLFPWDDLQPNQHAVDPDRHYYVLSKRALFDSPLPQPLTHIIELADPTLDMNALKHALLSAPMPYVLKSNHGLSGTGTWVVQNKQDLLSHWPAIEAYRALTPRHCPLLFSEFIHHSSNVCVQFYLKRTGHIVWLGVTEQIVSSGGSWLGSQVDYSKQSEYQSTYRRVAEIAAEFLSRNGYFGVVGMDVVTESPSHHRDDNRRHEQERRSTEGEVTTTLSPQGQYVIDLNPRINGSTALLCLRQGFEEAGLHVARFVGEVTCAGTAESVLQRMSPLLSRRELLLLSLVEHKRDSAGEPEPAPHGADDHNNASESLAHLPNLSRNEPHVTLYAVLGGRDSMDLERVTAELKRLRYEFGTSQ